VISRPRSPARGRAAVFVAVAHCSAECCGFAKAVARGLAVRHDHGSQYLSNTFQHELAFLGIESSPALSAPRKATAAPNDSSAP
jgi:hypothetical protein